jgi:hypothetical protein
LHFSLELDVSIVRKSWHLSHKQSECVIQRKTLHDNQQYAGIFSGPDKSPSCNQYEYCGRHFVK